MKKILRLSLALLLTFSLIFSSMIFASAEVANITSGDDFVTAITNGVPAINITNDITVSSTVTISKSTTIHAGNHNITFSGFTGGEIFTVTGTGVSFAIHGGNWNSEGTAANFLFAKTDTLTEGTILFTGGATFTVDRQMVLGVGTSGRFVLDDAQVTTSKGSKGEAAGIQNRGAMDVQLLSGSWTVTGDKSMYDTNNTCTGDLILGRPDGTGPAITATNTSNSNSLIYTQAANKKTRVVFYGGTYTHKGTGKVYNMGTQLGLLILGGKFVGEKTTSGNSVLNIAGSGTVNIMGGEFVANAAGYIINAPSGAVTMIKGGTFTDNSSASPFNNSGTLKIAGGTYNFDPSSYLAAFTKATSASGTYTVADDYSELPAAETVNTYDALTAAISVGTKHIKLGADISDSSGISITYDMVLDGNGKTLSGFNIGVNGTGIRVTFKNLNATRSSDVITIQGNPDFTLSGGEVYINRSSTSDNEGAIYNKGTGIITVTDGAALKATNGYAYYTIDYNDSACTYSLGSSLLRLLDCTAEGVDTTYSLIYDRNNANIHVDGATITQEGGNMFLFKRGNYVVKSGTLTHSGSKPIFKPDGTKSNLTIVDGTIDHNGTSRIYDAESGGIDYLEVLGGKLTSGSNNNYDAYKMGKNGTYLKISGGDFTASKCAIFQLYAGLLHITGGSFTQTSGSSSKIISTSTDNADLTKIAIICGGTFTNNGSGRLMEANHTNSNITFNGGTFVSNSNSDAIRFADSSANVTVNGGDFTVTGSNVAIFQKNGNALTINGGTFNVTQSNSYVLTSGNASGKLEITSTDDSIVVNSAGPFLRNKSTAEVVITGLNITQSSNIIEITADGGDITLNNCQLTSAGTTISSASEAVINLTNNTVITSTGNEPIVGGTVEKDASSSVVVPVLHEFVQLINDTPAGGTVTVNKAYTDVPVITLDKDLTFTGEGSIAFATTGFVIQDANVVFAEGSNITVTMGAEDSGSNRLIELTDKSTTASTLTINGGTFTGYIRVGSSATLTINGGTFNQKNHQLFDISNGLSTLTINDGNFVGNGNAMLIRTNDSSASLIIYGGTFTQSGNNELLHIRSLKDLIIGNADGTGPEMTHTGKAFLMKIGSAMDYTTCRYNINGGTFTKKGGEGYLFDLDTNMKSTFNINGGYWKITHNASLIRLNDGDITDFRINGGTFETTSTSEPVIYKNNGKLTVTGGTFITGSSAGAIHTGNSHNTGKLIIDGTNDPNAIVFKHKGYGPAIYYRAQFGLEIKNVNLTRTGDYAGTILAISSTASNDVTITDSNFTSDYATIELGNDLPETLATNITFTNSDFVSNKSRAIANLVGLVNGNTNANYYDNLPVTLENCQVVDATDLKADTRPKMVRFAGQKSGSGSVLAIATKTNTLPAGTYTLTLNYRETGGAMPYVTVNADGVFAAIPADSYDNRGTATYTFTLAKEGQVIIGIGRANIHQAGAMYYGNIKLTAEGSSENLLNNAVDNADFSLGYEGTAVTANFNTILPGWSHSNVSSYNSVRVMAIPSDDFFTADNPVTAENYVYKFEEGSYDGIRLRFHMREDTRYEFSYTYMANSGNQRDSVSKPGMDRPFTMETVTTSKDGLYKTVVRFDLGNDGDEVLEYEGSTIRIGGSNGAYGNIQYVGNFEMYEIDENGNRITGRNLMVGFNPLYETEGSFPITDNSAVASDFENAYGIHFDNTSSAGDALYVVKVDDNFFAKLTFAERRSNARKYLIKNDVHTDLTYDYSIDKAVNVIDLLRLKKYESGFVGADFEAAQLKNQILNTGNTAIADTSKVLYVSYSSGNNSNDGKSESKPLKDLSTAISKASSGWTILLKRGDEWRIPSNTDGNGWTLKSGITLGSYGTGAKPVLNGSVKNYAGKWTAQGNNIWKISLDNKGSANIPGNLYFYTADDKNATPAMIGTIVKDQIPIGQTWDSNEGEWVDSDTPMAKLTKNGDVYKDYDAEAADWWSQIFGSSGSKNDVYVYYDGDLNNDFARIEITESKDLLFADSKSNITVDNIEVKHSGAHGMNFRQCSNITITNCVIGYVGGSPSENSALGNGIQFGKSGSNCTVNNNYVYQCYDAGISPQNWEDSITYNFTDIVITNNLMEKNFYNIEFWNDNGSMEMTVTGNIFKDAAYGWAWNQRYLNGNHNMYGAHIYGGKNAYNKNLTLNFSNNVFDNTQANIFCWYWGGRENVDELGEKYPMTMSGNTYYQRGGSNDGGQVNFYGKTTSCAYASSQENFVEAVNVLDSEAVEAGRVNYLPEWVTNLAAGK